MFISITLNFSPWITKTSKSKPKNSISFYTSKYVDLREMTRCGITILNKYLNIILIRIIGQIIREELKELKAVCNSVDM